MRIESRVLPGQLPDLGDLPPLLTRLYAARGVREAAELDRSLKALLPVSLFKGMEQAVRVLREALEQQQSILIVGDFDCDGATASAVAMLGLRAMGAAKVDYLVPNRFEYGYGLTPEIVEVALTRQPDVLVTVDNGISSVDGVAAARAAGLKVVVTDHHLPGEHLPAADAIVNPSQPGCDFPSKAIAGVGLALDLTLRELQDQLKSKGHPWERAKAFDGACPLSPFAPIEQAPALTDLPLQLHINGELRQDGNSAEMITPIIALLQHIAGVFTLLPGDVVITGTPAGVGVLQAGDQLQLSIPGLMQHTTHIAAN